MTSQIPASREPGDPFEDRLAARLGRLAEGGVRPIDAAAIAHAAVTSGGRRGFASGLADRVGAAGAAARLAWLLAGAALVGATALGGAALAGGHLGFPAAATPTGLVASAPTATPGATEAASTAACSVGDLAATIVRWTGAAGSRIADVTVRNIGSSACSIATMDRPQLIDGHQVVLIEGAAPTTKHRITLPSGGAATTEVEDSNYCGAAPVAPVSLAFVLANGDRLVADPVSASDTSGVAPCNGAGEPGMVQMQPWAR